MKFREGQASQASSEVDSYLIRPERVKAGMVLFPRKSKGMFVTSTQGEGGIS